MKFSFNKTYRGFSLIEILMVIAIIGIASAIGFSVLKNNPGKDFQIKTSLIEGFFSKVRTENIKQYKIVIEIKNSNNGVYLHSWKMDDEEKKVPLFKSLFIEGISMESDLQENPINSFEFKIHPRQIFIVENKEMPYLNFTLKSLYDPKINKTLKLHEVGFEWIDDSQK